MGGSEDDVIVKVYPQGPLIAGVPQYVQVISFFNSFFKSFWFIIVVGSDNGS